jgi:hypothetical protein
VPGIVLIAFHIVVHLNVSHIPPGR